MNHKALKVLAYYNGLFVFANGLLGPLYAIYVERLHGGVIAVSLSWSVFLISSTIFMFILLKLGDRIKEKEYLLLGGYLVRAIVWLFFIFANTLNQIIVLQFLLGISQALSTPAFDSLFAEHLDKGRHIADYSTWNIIMHMTIAGGTLAGGVIVAKFGFGPLFMIMSLLATVSFFGVLLKPRKLL